jgi:hypothetical protein
MKRGFVRKLSALLAVAIVVPTLVACSSPSNECVFPSGDASSVVTAEGAIGSEPQIDMPTPVVAQRTEVSIVTEGEGKPLSDGQPARVDISIINGATGEVLEDTGYAGGVLFAAGSEALPPVTEALECASVGSRLVVVGTAEETHNGEPLPQLGVEANDSLVFVVDVLDSFLPRADGTQRASENGNPAVVLAPNGQPGVTIPNSAPPTELVDTLLKEGVGDTVEEGDQVVVHYTGFTWADSEVFDSSWENRQPAIFQLTEGALIEGFLTGLIDKKVGSQVLLVIPPELGYGDQASESIPADSTLVFVVDILGIAE